MTATLDITALTPTAAEVLEDPAFAVVRDRLREGAIVADVGARSGRSTVSLAAAYPRSAFAGYDADRDCVAAARRRARADGAGDNVRFAVADAAAIPAYAYDVVTTFGDLHEAGSPDAIARHVRSVLAPEGVWLLHAEAGVAVPVPALLRALLERAGFSAVRVVERPGSRIIAEARP